MIIKVQNETPFQILTGAFTIGPSETGYVLQVGATPQDFATLFSVGANTTRMVTNVANGSYYRLKNNVGEVKVNWSRTCVTEGGGGTTYTAGDYIDITEDIISVTGITPDAYLTSADTENLTTKTYVDSADTIIYASAATYADDAIAEALAAYTPTSGFSTINGSAITNGSAIVIETGDIAPLSAAVETLSAGTTGISNNLNALSGEVQSLSGTTTGISNNLNALSGATTGLSNNLNALSGEVQSLSGATTGISNNLNALSGEVQSLSAGTIQLSADTKAAIDNAINGLDSSIAVTAGKYITGIAIADGKISGITEEVLPMPVDLSAATIELSASVVTNQNNISTLSGATTGISNNINALSGATTGISSDLNTLSGEVQSLSAGTTDISSDLNTLSAATESAIATIPENPVQSLSIDTIWKGTQAEYDAATESGATADPNTFYIIV